MKKILFSIAGNLGINRLAQWAFMHSVFIIGYHSVAGAYPKVTIDKDLFESQIKFLAEHGHDPIHFSDLNGIGQNKISKPTIIYFDDGFKDNLTIALPILQKYNFTATVFVVPANADNPGSQYLSWDDIRALKAQGFEIGSHTLNHVKLTEVGEEEAREEIVSSKARIEKEIGKPVTAFSYPKGGVNEKIAAMVHEAGYEHAVTTRYGTNSINDLKYKKYLLRKVAPRVYENMREFSVRLYGANFFYNIFR